MFNSELFPVVDVRTESDFNFTSYQSTDNSMILFSNTCVPLVGFTFISRVGKNKTIIAPSSLVIFPGTQTFQGLIQKDKQEIAFILTNFTKFNINFNLINKNEYCINEVNLLQPYQTYTVECDKTSGNKTMILEGITETKSDGSQEKLSVKQDVDNGKDSKGTFIRLVVIPPEGEDVINTLFSETVWRCVDFFVIKETKVQLDEYDENQLVFQQDKVLEMSSSMTTVSENNVFENEVKRGCIIDKSRKLIIDKSPKLESFTAYSSRRNVSLTQQAINNSNASKLKAGIEIEVKSKASDISLNYGLMSVPCILGLSVAEDLIFSNQIEISPEQLKKDIDCLIKQYADKKFEEFLSIKTYTEDKCVICLEESPDQIFYRCGHLATHYGCDSGINKCPLCRGKIVARRINPV